MLFFCDFLEGWVALIGVRGIAARAATDADEAEDDREAKDEDEEDEEREAESLRVIELAEDSTGVDAERGIDGDDSTSNPTNEEGGREASYFS